MAVQDDRRENEIISLLNLIKGTERSGTDAFYKFRKDEEEYQVEIELKSTTNLAVSTARDVGTDHIKKWRSKYWIIAFYDSSGKKLNLVLGLNPEEMEPWIHSVEKSISPDFKISSLAAERLQLTDLYEVCENKSTYSYDDARKLMKNQWNVEKYKSEEDVIDGYSKEKMLKMLKLRSKYLGERGSTLNNPHIPQSFFKKNENKMIKAEVLRTSDGRNEFLQKMTEDWLRYRNG